MKKSLQSCWFRDAIRLPHVGSLTEFTWVKVETHESDVKRRKLERWNIFDLSTSMPSCFLITLMRLFLHLTRSQVGNRMPKFFPRKTCQCTMQKNLPCMFLDCTALIFPNARSRKRFSLCILTAQLEFQRNPCTTKFAVVRVFVRTTVLD